VVNSGALPFGPGSFSMKVDADPGDVFWVICLIHTHMRMKVTVVADDAAASSQSSIDSAAAATIAEDSEHAQALDAKLNKPTSHTSGGSKVYDAFAGFDTHHVTMYRMYPRKMTVPKNSTVRWHFSELVYEIHSVTFPQAEALQVAQTVGNIPSCDPDGPGGEPNNPPDTEAPPFCNDPSQLEFLVSAQAAFPRGDGVVKNATDYENSGVRGVDLGPPTAGHADYNLRFTKASDTAYKYICLVHPFMRGSVKVK
jgi:plastocyanin